MFEGSAWLAIRRLKRAAAVEMSELSRAGSSELGRESDNWVRRCALALVRRCSAALSDTNELLDSVVAEVYKRE